MRRDVRFIARVATAAGIAAALWPLAACEAQAPRTAVLSGVITNLNGVPLAKVEVMIVNTDLRAVTNDSGVYAFVDAPAAKVRVIARRIGFEPEENRVTLDAAKPRQIKVEVKA